MKTNRILYILPIALGLVACEPEFEDIDFNDGSADFTSFVTVGNSLTAGFQSNALRREKQEVSLSAMLAGQLKLVGSGEFKQPLMDPGVGLGPAGNAEFGLFIKQGKLEKDELGAIELKQDCCFVSVPASKAKELISNLNNTKLKKKKVRIKLV